ncbi:MAG: 50S ribosomal protein L9 [Lentisphaerae bacterium ADurb.BinA184]|nr:MAG: 50S ribosomal protein L9 [Lentisphaerae bacterium ADurb.BinA184]
MAVELILLEDVKDLGQLGDKVRVAEGYARNYLLPRHLAARATKATLRILEAKKLALQKQAEDRLAVAQAMAEKITQTSVTLTMEATEENKLYGSVGAQQVVDALKEIGIEIERHAVQLAEPIKETGVFNLDIKLHDDVQAVLKLWVVAKKEPGQPAT